MLFPLGQVVATPRALHVLAQKRVDARLLLRRHGSGDWGELTEHDRCENAMSVAKGFRILSNYPVGGGARVWIITEADRSVTTILLPDEY